MAVNLHGIFAAMQAEIHHMQDRGGAIVNIGSGAAYIGLVQSPAYTASKHAVIGLTKAAAAQYAEAGIRINAVCPGTTRTPLLPSTATREVFYEFAVPLKRVAEPQELAEAILWLCAEDAINGYSLIVDGGALAGPRSMSFSGQQIAELIRKLGAAALKDRFGRKQRKAER
jgi:NAD(P)-dependent dehydrogenase (short-subunit alcohol dehydrogenase family)